VKVSNEFWPGMLRFWVETPKATQRTPLEEYSCAYSWSIIES